MFARIRFVWLALCAVAWGCTLAAPAAAQCPAKTTVADTLFNADGSLASGRVTIAWPTILIGSCQVIAGQTAVTVPNGAFSVQLYPNTSAVPSGTSYRVTFALKSGRITTEYWVVPASAASVALAAVRAPSVPVPAVMLGESQVTNLVADLAKKLELPSPCPPGKVLESNGSGTPPQVNCVDPSGGSGAQHQVNGVNLASNGPVNFKDTPSIAFTNPSAGNLQATIADGAVTAAKLAVSSPSAAQLAGIGDGNIAVAALSPDRIVGTAVAQARSINTTSPITGGGDLSADRALSCPTCEVSTNKNAANGYAGLDSSARIAKVQAPSTTVYADQSNTWTAGSQDMGNASSLIVPKAAGAAPTAGGDIRYDTAQAATVAGGNQSTTGFIPRVMKMTNCTTEGNCTSASGGNQVDAASGAQGTTETNFASNWSMPANFLFTNKAIQVCASFEITTSATAPTSTIRFKLGSSAVAATGALAPGNSQTNRSYAVCIIIQGTVAAGASVSVEAGGFHWPGMGAGSTTPNTVNQPASGIATNGALTVQISWQWGAATTGNTAQLHQFYVMELN